MATDSRVVGVRWRCRVEQQVQAAGEHHRGQHAVQPAGREQVRGPGADQGSDGGGEQGATPVRRMEQLAPIEGPGRGGGAEGGAELVGAQHQMGRQPGGEQRGNGQQAAATGDGVDETGGEGHRSEDRQGEWVQRKFEGHANLVLWLIGHASGRPLCGRRPHHASHPVTRQKKNPRSCDRGFPLTASTR
ncbi:hypothetical protein D3C78_1379240 [compost metagenome]